MSGPGRRQQQAWIFPMVAIHLSCKLATDPVVHRLVNIWQANANRLMDMRCSVNITPSPMTCGHLLSNQLRLRSRWFTLVQRRVPVQMTPFQHKHIITLKLTRRTVRSINVWDIDAILFFFFFLAFFNSSLVDFI